MFGTVACCRGLLNEYACMLWQTAAAVIAADDGDRLWCAATFIPLRLHLSSFFDNFFVSCFVCWLFCHCWFGRAHKVRASMQLPLHMPRTIDYSLSRYRLAIRNMCKKKNPFAHHNDGTSFSFPFCPLLKRHNNTHQSRLCNCEQQPIHFPI